MFFQNLDKTIFIGNPCKKNEERVNLFMQNNPELLKGINLVICNYTIKKLREYLPQLPQSVKFDKELFCRFERYAQEFSNQMGNSFYAVDYLAKNDYTNYVINAFKPDIVLISFTSGITFVELNDWYHANNSFQLSNQDMARLIRNKFLEMIIAEQIGAKFLALDTRYETLNSIVDKMLVVHRN